jgi:hypothetical protein
MTELNQRSLLKNVWLNPDRLIISKKTIAHHTFPERAIALTIMEDSIQLLAALIDILGYASDKIL